MKITVKLFHNSKEPEDIFGPLGTDGIDYDSSMAAYFEIVTKEIKESYPEAEIEIVDQLHTYAVQIFGEEYDPYIQPEIQENIEHILNATYSNMDFWIVEENAR